jgi:hypothetical protein
MIRRIGTAVVIVMAFLILGASLDDVATRTETNWSSK